MLLPIETGDIEESMRLNKWQRLTLLGRRADGAKDHATLGAQQDRNSNRLPVDADPR